MSMRCIIAAAGSGKTDWVITQAREKAEGLVESPRIVVPTRLLAENLSRRVAQKGGALGIRVGTLGDLAEEILQLGGQYPVLLSESIRKKTLRAAVSPLSLTYFQGIKDKAGFISICLAFISELKAGAISPEAFLVSLDNVGGDQRLSDLGLVYQSYQQILREKNWSDPAGLIWLAAETLEYRSQLCEDWGPLYIDGFDDLSPVQLRMIKAISKQVKELDFTLTGSTVGGPRKLVHKRFLRLKETLERIGCQVVSLSEINPSNACQETELSALEKGLFDPGFSEMVPRGSGIELVGVPDRETEIRTALRWIRQKIQDGSLRPGETALLMRKQEPYRALVDRIAREYQMPVHILGGLPLIENPAVAAVWGLIKMAESGRSGLIWHEVIALWRSPYFNWGSISTHIEKGEKNDRHLQEARQLEEVARWGRVIQGYEQWREAFDLLLDRDGDLPALYNAIQPPDGIAGDESARRLWDKFQRFVALIDRKGQRSSSAVHVSWLEDLLGGSAEGDDLGLDILGNIMEGPAELIERDVRALRSLTGLLWEMIAAEDLLGSEEVSFTEFVEELEGLIKASSYQPYSLMDDAILCADCTEARGMPFSAVALLGIAEGEFPQTIREDPFLRDRDRAQLREKGNLPLRLSTDSAEAEYFYEAVTRPSLYLLLTRPRIADNGAPWQSSPYWEEVERLVEEEPKTLTAASSISPGLAASWWEYLELIAREGRDLSKAAENAGEGQRNQINRIIEGGKIIRLRLAKDLLLMGNFEGDLTGLGAEISRRYPADTIWSASRLESYQTCPFSFFIGNLLGLEVKEPPAEGLDGRQLGNIYHQILEDLYNAQVEDYQLSDLLDQLPAIAQRIFAQAPYREGFRETAWWDQTQQEILVNLRLSIVVLESLEPQYRFYSAEQRFGIGREGKPHLEVDLPDGGKIMLRGLIDRIDLAPEGELRIIDYKTSGPYAFSHRSVREGKKLQLPLYALAAEKLLELGRVQEGFYFHLQAAQPSSFSLASFSSGGEKGPAAAMDTAVRHASDALAGISEGMYSPSPPSGGCPDYCPAAGFCWKYTSRSW